MATTIRTTSSSGWDLDENEVMTLPHRRAGSLVRVQRGTVLVTQEGDGEDHVLEPGDELLLRRRGRAVAWAFTDATISLRAARPASPRMAPAAAPRGESCSSGAR